MTKVKVDISPIAASRICFDLGMSIRQRWAPNGRPSGFRAVFPRPTSTWRPVPRRLIRDFNLDNTFFQAQWRRRSSRIGFSVALRLFPDDWASGVYNPGKWNALSGNGTWVRFSTIHEIEAQHNELIRLAFAWRGGVGRDSVTSRPRSQTRGMDRPWTAFGNPRIPNGG